MQIAVIGYLLLGIVCCLLLSRYAAKNKVASTFAEALITLNLVVIALYILLWPMFILNDLLLYIPQQRKDRLKHLLEQRKERHRQRAERKKRRPAVVGLTGFAVSDLRLAGDVEVDGQQWMATSADGYITSGTPIVVLGWKDALLRVRAAKE